jgi:dUTP pyrophosphatase
MPFTLSVQRLDPSVPLPSYAHHGDAGLDLYAREAVTLVPGERAQVATGVAVEIPHGYVGLVWDKSGLSHKYGIKTLGGVVDAGYRGEIFVGVVNLGTEPYTFERHHKVAQMIIQRCEQVEVKEVTDLSSSSSRGTSGFGSTGK